MFGVEYENIIFVNNFRKVIFVNYRRKKLLQLFVILFTMILLSGCNGKKIESDENIVIKIGVILDFSNEKASESEQMFKVMQLAADEINDNGGVLKEHYQVELIKKDDKGEALNAAAAYYQLQEEGALAVIGSNTPECMKQLMDISNQVNISIITPTVSDDFVVKAADFAFQSCISDKYITQAMISYLCEEIGEKKVAVIYNPLDSDEIVLYEDFITSALSKNMEIAYAAEYDAALDESIIEVFKAIEKSGTRYVYVPAGKENYTKIILNAAKEAGYSGSFLGMLKQIEENDTCGYDIIVPVNMSADSEKKDTLAFIDKVKTRFDIVQDIKNTDKLRTSYDAVYMIIDAIEKGYLPTSAMVALKLPFLEGNLLTGYYEIGAYGNVKKAVDIICVKDSDSKYITTVFE